MCFYADGPGRAVNTALTAAYTVCFCQSLIKRRHDHSVGTTESEAQDTQALDLAAGTDAVAAEDTFVGVADQSRRTGVQRTDLSGVLEPDCGDIHSVSQILEYTFAAFYTGGTVAAVGGEEQLYNKFSVFFDPAGVSVDHHAVSWHFGTGSKSPSSVVFYGTQATGTEGRHF